MKKNENIDKEEIIKKEYGRVGKEILDIINKSKDDKNVDRGKNEK